MNKRKVTPPLMMQQKIRVSQRWSIKMCLLFWMTTQALSTNFQGTKSVHAISSILYPQLMPLLREELQTKPTRGCLGLLLQNVMLWNKTSRSTMAHETVERECKLQFLRPNQTRWSSLFLAVERIVRIHREQGEQAIRNVCTALKIKM